METRCGVTLVANMVSNKRFRPLVPKLSLTHASHILNASNSNPNSISISSPSICSITNDANATQQENPNIHKNKPSLTISGSHGEKCLLESCKIEGQAQPSSGTRWNPTAEQIRMLETLYKGGMRTPNAHQIEKITAQLKIYGKIEGKNVFYWFQNHKARERQKQKRSVQPPQAPDSPSPSPSPSPTPAQTMPVREAADHREADVNCFLSNFLFLANSKLSPNSSPRMVDSTSSKGSSLDPDMNLDEQTDANAKHTSYKRKSRSWPLKEESNLHLNWEQRGESDHLRQVPRASDGMGEVYTLELFPLHPEGLQLQALQSRLSPHLQCSRWCDSPTMFAHYTDPSSKL